MPSWTRRGLRLTRVDVDADGSDADTNSSADADTDGADADSDPAEDTDVHGGTDGAEDTLAAAEADNAPKGGPVRTRRSLPRIKVSPTAVVAALLVVLVGAGSYLFITRPMGRSAIELTAFDEILSVARSGIVDVTSFDYLTLDQDIAEIEAVTTGELYEEAVGTLQERRQQLITDQQVSSTEVVAAAITEASATQASALIVLRARQKSLLTPQETVTRYRVEVILELVDGSWLLSGLTGR